MVRQSVSQRQEDPLSTHPVFLFALWIGILVIITGIVGKSTWHERAYTPSGNFSGLASLDKSFQEKKFIFQPVNVAAAAEAPREEVEKSLEQDVTALVSGYPIATMAPYIAKQDRKVAAFLVGIAKKESDWGNHVPTKNGQDCYNYWGYKGAGSLGQGMGYACFGSPEEAVTIVGGRLYTLVIEKENETPREMVIWKCGSRSCVGHEPAAVSKWINDVGVYYSKLVAMAQ